MCRSHARDEIVSDQDQSTPLYTKEGPGEQAGPGTPCVLTGTVGSEASGYSHESLCLIAPSEWSEATAVSCRTKAGRSLRRPASYVEGDSEFDNLVPSG